MKLVKLTILFIVIALAFNISYAQSQTQTLNLKSGFNFISFTLKPIISPQEFIQKNPSVEDIYAYSAVAGSFISVKEGTLNTLNIGKGYIVKTNNAVSINISGDIIQTIGNISLKTGFNLVGFSKANQSIKFVSLMTSNPIIKGIYKWSPASGSFIQVVQNNTNQPEALDGIDPEITIGQSFFLNVTGDTTLNYDGAGIIFGNSGTLAKAKRIEISGEVGTTALTPFLRSISRMIDNTGFQISVFDEINNTSIEGSEASLLGQNTYKIAIPTTSNLKYASVIIKNTENKVIYKTFLGRIPASEEVDEDIVRVANLRIDDSTTAKSILIVSKKNKLPSSAIIAKKSVDALTGATTFAQETRESFGETTPILKELEKIVAAIRGVIVKTNIDEYVRSKATINSFNSLSDILDTYVKLVNHYDYLTNTHGIYVPASIYFGTSVLKADSTSASIQAALDEIDKVTNRALLKSIEISKTTDSVIVGTQYDLSAISATAIFSDGSRKTVIPYWKRKPGSEGAGTIWINSGKWVFTPAQDTYEVSVLAEYTVDNTIFKTTELILRLTSDKPLRFLSLSKNKGYTSTYKDLNTEIIYGDYPLSSINATATYEGGATRIVNCQWEIINGRGRIGGSSSASNSIGYITTGSSETVLLRAKYTENGITMASDFILKVDERTELSGDVHREKITSAGGLIVLGDSTYNDQLKATLEIPAGAIKDSAEITFIKHSSSSSLNNVIESLHEIKANEAVKQFDLSFPITGNINKDYVYAEFYNPNTQKLEAIPEECLSIVPVNVNINAPINRFGIEETKWCLKLSITAAFVYSLNVPLSGRDWSFVLRWWYKIKYTPKNDSVAINIPYYLQTGGSCAATVFGRLLNAYYPNENFNIPRILHVIDKNKNDGVKFIGGLDIVGYIGTFGFYPYSKAFYTKEAINLLNMLGKGTYSQSDTLDDSYVKVISFHDKSYGYFWDTILEQLDNKCPVIVNGGIANSYVDGHAYIAHGYIKDNKTGQIKILIHDNYKDIEVAEMGLKDTVWARFPNIFSNFLIYKTSPLNGIDQSTEKNIVLNCEKRLTTQLIDKEEISGIAKNETRGIYIVKANDEKDYIVINKDGESGYQFINSKSIELSPGFKSIQFNQIPLSKGYGNLPSKITVVISLVTLLADNTNDNYILLKEDEELTSPTDNSYFIPNKYVAGDAIRNRLSNISYKTDRITIKYSIYDNNIFVDEFDLSLKYKDLLISPKKPTALLSGNLITAKRQEEKVLQVKLGQEIVTSACQWTILPDLENNYAWSSTPSVSGISIVNTGDFINIIANQTVLTGPYILKFSYQSYERQISIYIKD